MPTPTVGRSRSGPRSSFLLGLRVTVDGFQLTVGVALPSLTKSRVRSVRSGQVPFLARTQTTLSSSSRCSSAHSTNCAGMKHTQCYRLIHAAPQERQCSHVTRAAITAAPVPAGARSLLPWTTGPTQSVSCELASARPPACSSSAQGRAPVQPVLSPAAGAKRVSVGVRRWGNFRGLSQARRRTLAADDRPARLGH